MCVLNYHDLEWLQAQRFPFISNSGYRSRTIHAGSLGTRLNIGRPQPRYLEGIRLAQEVSAAGGDQDRAPGRGLSIHSILDAAIRSIRNNLTN